MRLPENYVDPILDASMGGKKQYLVTDLANGKKNIEDSSTYTKQSSKIGSAAFNNTNAKVNQNADNSADEYDSTRTYEVGEFCIYGNILYKCSSAITVVEKWNATHWTATSVGEELTQQNKNLNGGNLILTVVDGILGFQYNV